MDLGSVLMRRSVTMWNKGLFGYNYPGQAGGEFLLNLWPNRTVVRIGVGRNSGADMDACASDEKQNWNNNWPVVPLRKKDNLTEEQWFAHGLKSYPPKNGDYMELVSGSDYTGEPDQENKDVGALMLTRRS